MAWLSTIKFSALAAGAALVSLAVAEPAARGIAARALRFGAIIALLLARRATPAP